MGAATAKPTGADDRVADGGHRSADGGDSADRVTVGLKPASASIFGNSGGTPSKEKTDEIPRASATGTGRIPGGLPRKDAKKAFSGEPLSTEKDDVVPEPKSKAKSKASSKKITLDEADQVAEALIATVETAAVLYVGNRAVEFTDDEHDKVLEPLARIVYRMNPAMSKRFQAFADPIALITALGFYGMRVVAIQQAMAYQRAHPNYNPQQQPSTGQETASYVNGNVEVNPADGVPGAQAGGQVHSVAEGIFGGAVKPGTEPNFRA